jgi:hypothetical protein
MGRRRKRRRERRWRKSSGKEEGRSRRILNVTRGNCRSVRGCKVRDTRDKRTRIKCRHSNRLSGTRGCLGCLESSRPVQMIPAVDNEREISGFRVARGLSHIWPLIAPARSA